MDVASTTVDDSLSRRQKIIVTSRRTSLSACSGRTGKILCLAAVMLVLSLVGTSEAGHPRKDRMRGYLDAGTALYGWGAGGAGGKGLTGAGAETCCVGGGGNLVRVDSEDVRQIVAGLTGGDHSKVRFPHRAHCQCFPGLHSALHGTPKPLFMRRRSARKDRNTMRACKLGRPSLEMSCTAMRCALLPGVTGLTQLFSSAGLDRPALERTLMGMERTASGRST